MPKATSIEGIVEQPVAVGGHPRARLADFDIGGATLKKNHREWLDGLAAFLRRKRIPHGRGRWVISVKGRASNSGEADYNKWLAQQRVDAVMLHLMPQLSGIEIDTTQASLGEDFLIEPAVNENWRDRAVDIDVAPRIFKTDPPPPPRFDPKPKLSHKPFELIVEKMKVDMWQVKIPHPWFTPRAGWSYCQMNLRIIDLTTHESANYFFDGSGVMTAGDGDAMSRGRGRPQEFKGDAALTEFGFEGESRLHLGVGTDMSFRFGATGSLHDFKGELSGFRLPPMDNRVDGVGTMSGPLTLGVGRIDE